MNGIVSFDSRRDIARPGDKEATLEFCVDHFNACAGEAIQKRGSFYVALSGGSTPKAIYQALASPENIEKIDWSNVYLFWSDERCVPADDPDSNFKMAMDNGIGMLPIPKSQVFRMKGELHPEESAKEYDAIIQAEVPDQTFDLVMLGMGDDGHTASLFPKTHGLHPIKREAIANYIPQKDTWRLTLTFDCINRARNIVVYVLGAGKAETLSRVLTGEDDFDLLPSQRLGSTAHKALWVVDDEAGQQLNCGD